MQRFDLSACAANVGNRTHHFLSRLLVIILLLLGGSLQAQDATESGGATANRSVPDRLPLFLPERATLDLKPIASLSGNPAKENSGIVQSRRQPGLYWLHNDSGDEPRIYPLLSNSDQFMVDETVEAGAGTLLSGAENIDWEDITVDDQGHVIVADVGNNKNKRRDLTLVLYR